MITAIILVKNEEDTIGKVLEQLQWTDEQIVVDNGSTDNTIVVAKKKHAIVLSVSELNFSRMRNEAAVKAKNDWLLYIDTDEQIPPELKKEILKITRSSPSATEPHAFVIKRKNYYMKTLWPFSDGMVRLIYKPSLKQWYGKIHETAMIKGTVGTLTHVLDHKTHNTLEDMLIQTNDWSDVEGALRFSNNHPRIVSWRLFRVFLTGIFDSYIRQRGWKTGTIGIIESMYQGFSLFITYAKLWEMQEIKEKNPHDAKL